MNDELILTFLGHCFDLNKVRFRENNTQDELHFLYGNSLVVFKRRLSGWHVTGEVWGALYGKEAHLVLLSSLGSAPIPKEDQLTWDHISCKLIDGVIKGRDGRVKSVLDALKGV